MNRSVSGLIEERARREALVAADAVGDPQSVREIEDQLAELRDLPGAASAVFVDLLRDLLRSRPEQREERGRGRPPRAESVDRDVLLASPMPELLVASAGEARELVRRVDDRQRLMEAYTYALRHDRRRSVLTEIRDRLKRLGVPAEDIELLANDSPKAPWNGYGALAVTPANRREIRGILAARCESELQAALDYEVATKRRVGMIAAISKELLRRGAAETRTSPGS